MRGLCAGCALPPSLTLHVRRNAQGAAEAHGDDEVHAPAVQLVMAHAVVSLAGARAHLGARIGAAADSGVQCSSTRRSAVCQTSAAAGCAAHWQTAHRSSRRLTLLKQRDDGRPLQPRLQRCCAALPCRFAPLHSGAATYAAQHHVPHEEMLDGALLVLGCLTLRWPFTAAAASCPNARVLERVTALLAAEQ